MARNENVFRKHSCLQCLCWYFTIKWHGSPTCYFGTSIVRILHLLGKTKHLSLNHKLSTMQNSKMFIETNPSCYNNCWTFTTEFTSVASSNIQINLLWYLRKYLPCRLCCYQTLLSYLSVFFCLVDEPKHFCYWVPDNPRSLILSRLLYNFFIIHDITDCRKM